MSDPSEYVGAIQRAYGIGAHPLAHSMLVSPDGMLPLLFALRDFTDQIQERNTDRVGLHGGFGDPLDERVEAWSQRLDWYIAVAQTPPDGEFEDPGAILWTVVAPLLAGHYYGPDGVDDLRPPVGWTDATQPPVDGAAPDLRTPVILMGEVTRGAYDFGPSLVEAFQDSAAEAPSAVGKAVGAAVAAALESAVVAAGVVGVRWWHAAIGAGVLYGLWKLKG